MTDIPEVHLSKEALFEEAEKRTGLNDWGEWRFTDGLDVLLYSVEKEATLNENGRVILWRRIIHLLSNWLELQADGYRNVSVDGRGMVFVMGMPRSGTTMLQRLLSQDPQAGFLRYADVRFITPATRIGSQADEEKLQQCRAVTNAIYEQNPTLLKIHEAIPDGPAEEVSLFEHQFISIAFPLKMHLPSYMNWYLETDRHVDSYREMNRLINYIAQYREFGHLVLKMPQHLFTLDALLKVLPEAKVIWIHRDPLKVIPSICNLSLNRRKMFTDSPSSIETKNDWFDAFRMGVNKAVIDRKRAHNQNTICDVLYQNLMEDPVSEVRRIYVEIGMVFSEEMETAIQNWLTENPQNKYGRHSYTLEQFGLTKDTVRDQFSDYIQQFNIPTEG